MANITSVSSAIIPANRVPGVIIAIVGLLITACAGCFFVGTLSSSGNTDAVGGAVVIGVGVLFGLLVMGAGIAIAVMTKPSYVVRIGSASGEANALVSKDRAFVGKIVNAMNEAIVKRG